MAGGILAAWFAAGCGSAVHDAGSAQPGTVAGCAAYGMQAIERHITVTGKPPPCRGLSQAEINQAAATAILRVAGGAPKAVWRRRAARVAPFLRYLITGPAAVSSPPAGSTWSGSSTRASGPLGARDLAMDAAALVAWIVTAASGSYVLGAWISRGGTLRQRADATGSPPMVVIGHVGLALAGLVIWIAYVTAGWAALAWTAVGVLLPVAGLGMAALAVGLPGRAPAVATGGGAVAVAVAGSIGRAPARRRLSPLVVVGHGLVAATTIMLVLLAALGTAAS